MNVRMQEIILRGIIGIVRTKKGLIDAGSKNRRFSSLMNSAETSKFSSFSTRMILFVAAKMVLAEIASTIITMPS
ncbi:MAG: hypothetical protein ACRD42_01190 [Nitrososphaeraceae archaeon]